jgi:hypothetical protein
MQFTPQQLTGGPKYHHSVRVGNWSEDLELEEIKLKDYLKKKETGSLIVTAKQRQLEESLQPAELSPSPEGVLCFGQSVMVVSHSTGGVLSANPYDVVPKTHDAYMVTTSRNVAASVRNVFVLQRANPNDGFDDDAVHYGQDLRLCMAPFSKISGPVYLHSEMVTALAAAKFSRHQEVAVHAAPNGETLWQLQYPDTKQREDMEGEAVPAGSPLCLRHVQTGSFLASDEINFANIFGPEFEVHAFHYFSAAKPHNLLSEKKGVITGETCLRKHSVQNIFTVMTATHGPGAEEGGAALETTLPGPEGAGDA